MFCCVTQPRRSLSGMGEYRRVHPVIDGAQKCIEQDLMVTDGHCQAVPRRAGSLRALFCAYGYSMRSIRLVCSCTCLLDVHAPSQFALCSPSSPGLPSAFPGLLGPLWASLSIPGPRGLRDCSTCRQAGLWVQAVKSGLDA